MPTIRQCLVNYPINYVTYNEDTSVSAKQNATNLPLLVLERHANGVFEASGLLLGEAGPDTARYGWVVSQPLASVQSEVKNEGDVRRVFAQLTLIIEQAFVNGPKVWTRWEAGPPGPGNTLETVDVWWGVYINGHQRCAAIGELKRPGVLNVAQWTAQNSNSPTQRLQKEIRM